MVKKEKELKLVPSQKFSLSLSFSPPHHNMFRAHTKYTKQFRMIEIFIRFKMFYVETLGWESTSCLNYKYTQAAKLWNYRKGLFTGCQPAECFPLLFERSTLLPVSSIFFILFFVFFSSPHYFASACIVSMCTVNIFDLLFPLVLAKKRKRTHTWSRNTKT